jgi:hypothetical protein
MRVKIQYSVELNEVPECVAELIEDQAGSLSFCDHLVDEVCTSLRQEDPNLKFVLNKIDKIRQTLGNFDNRLLEMENLLQGYESVTNPAQQPIPAQPMPEPELSAGPPNPNINPETGAYDYESPYAVPKESEK